ncbi:hypothetical protein AX660_19225 [Paraglaciecola hydrolytica]|uniref:Uncharacterized protein n=1 Tax=Paraglaciecola hydrolytica TaxID=1799789 RepID=A0A148KMZ2_9ALTE|nr:hypothetical protein AX660_19225 [Paraglaciecola hydrolytica]
MSITILKTSYSMIPIKVSLSPWIKLFTIQFGEQKKCCFFKTGTQQTQLEFNLANEDFYFKITTTNNTNVVILGIYHANVPYKLQALDLLDYKKISISSAISL